MKKIVLATTLATALFASDNFIEIGGGYSSGKDNFSTDTKGNISSYIGAESEKSGIPYLAFNYGYDFNDDFTVYINSMFGDLNLGSSIVTPVGLVDFGITTKLLAGEEWQNPFALNQNRAKTDVKESGAYIGYGIELMPGHESFLTYTYTQVEYDKETVQQELKRDAKRHVISLENVYRNYLLNLEYENYDADGEASTYTAYRADIGYQNKINDRLSYRLMIGAGKKEFDKLNPILNKKIDATLLGALASIRWEKPFDFKQTYVNFGVKADREDANHDFYDKDQITSFVSVGYKF